MLKGLILMLPLGLLNLLFMASANACDDRSCETAYLIETKQHISNHARRGLSSMQERHAYSENRERKAYALYVHYFLMKYGDPTDTNSKYFMKEKGLKNKEVEKEIAVIKKPHSET
ncbi:MAG: hypothetical protein V3V19_01980 [Cocleimonas sp.]